MADDKARAERQAAIVKRQYDQGIWSLFEYAGLQEGIAAAGDGDAKFKRDNSSLLATVPFWVWLALAGVVAWKLGLLKGAFEKVRK